MEFSSLLPELMISDFAKSLHFYGDILGFKIEYQREKPNFAFLSYQNKSQVMIQELEAGEKEAEGLEYPYGRGINFQIETSSVQKIIDALAKNKYPLKRGIKDSWYQNGKNGLRLPGNFSTGSGWIFTAVFGRTRRKNYLIKRVLKKKSNFLPRVKPCFWI